MEFQQVVGIRRSIRYFEPDKPVEQEKIQKILEACRVASCAVNAHWLKAVVVRRDDIAPADLEKMKNPVQANVIALAPVHIYFYGDPGVVNQIKGSRLKQLHDVGALNPTHGWSHKFVDEVVYPQILKPLTDNPFYPVALAFDCGVAACQGVLMAFDQGLGACLTAFVPEVVAKYTKVPGNWIPFYQLNVGYPAESREAGGQRPRPPFEEQYFLNQYGSSFPRDPKVVKELEASGLFTTPARPDNAERRKEIRDLARRLNLPM
ncbi:MAG: nitroreductase family protein [Deltaproteobacteria bacterium]|nr:nitroreductase family protein [Deltaproteobacteria bacterium]